MTITAKALETGDRIVGNGTLRPGTVECAEVHGATVVVLYTDGEEDFTNTGAVVKIAA